MTDLAPSDAGRPAAPAALVDAARLFAGPGEMRALHRVKDWGSTPLGPVETWPDTLRGLAAMVMAAPHPMFVWWGPEHIQLCNDAYRPSFGAGDRHVHAVGASGPAFWTEIWHLIGPDIAAVLGGRGAVSHRDQLVPIARNGTIEDVWWSYSYSPVYDDALEVAGVLVVCEETTGRVQQERERADRAQRVEAERERLASLFHQSPSFLAVLRGADNVFELVNPAYERIIGHGRDVIGKPLFDALPETRGQGFDAYLAQVRTTGEPLVFRDLPVLLERERGAPLEERFIDITYLPLVESDGTHDAVIAHGTDVTDHVRARRDIERLLQGAEAAAVQLAASEAATRRALDEVEATYRTAPVGLAVLDADLRFQRVNARLAEINGRSAEAHVGRTVREVVPALANAVEPRLRRIVETGQPEFDVPVSGETPAAPGVVRHWREQWLPLRDASGAVAGISIVAEEVTAQYEAEVERERLLAVAEAARAEADLERRRLRAVLEQLPVGVHLAEAPSGRLILDNAAIRTICGESPRSEGVEHYSADYAGHFPPGHSRAGEPLGNDDWPMARTLATGQSADPELVEIRRGDGTQRLVSINAVPVLDAEGMVVGAVATSIDVTEREILLAEAERARADAEAANRAKSEFLAVMSHELRTPLNAIDGYAELMELGIRGPLTAEQREDLARIRKSEKHLLGLINGVLNYAQVEAGAVHYDIESVLVDDVLLTCEALTTPQARTKGITLRRAPCDPGLTVRADREKLQQVVLNLLSNAIKFTEAGGEIDLQCTAMSRERGGSVRITVADTGIGIAPAHLARIFDPFVQVNSELTRTREGTGLGLAISRDLARGMGGDLTVESTPGIGSTFTLTLQRV